MYPNFKYSADSYSDFLYFKFIKAQCVENDTHLSKLVSEIIKNIQVKNKYDCQVA